MKKEVADQIEKLREEIERHNRTYYLDASPTISDEEFDALFRKLQQLESEHPELVSPDSPTQRVGGAPIGEFQTVAHRVPMLSMDNTYNPEELREFHDRIVKTLGVEPAYVAEPKIDGVSISLIYEKGRFIQGITRGDGRQGDDVTANLKTIKNLPLRLGAHAPPTLEVRGEIFFRNQEFLRINEQREEEGEPLLANPRNAAAGTLKLLDPKQVAARPLRFCLWGFGHVEGVRWKSYSESLKALAELGLPTSPLAKRIEKFDDLLAYVLDWAGERHKLDYQVDGMVVKVDDFAQREKLGFTSRAPRWQAAFKYAAEQAATKLLAIDVQVGKTGKLTPVAKLEPVHLAGTTVSRASLHNDEEIKRKDVRVGDTVIVQKAGEIIPQVVAVKTELRTGEEKEFEFPTKCPSCGSPVQRDEGGVYIRCTNRSCPAQFKEVLRYFANRYAMDIEGLGPAVIEQLVDQKLVRRLPDLYKLQSKDVEMLERMGKKSAVNLIAGIEASKSRGLTRVLAGLGIRHVGRRAAEILAENFGSMEKLLAADAEEIGAIHEIGPVMAASIVRYLLEEGGATVVADLAAAGVRMDEPRAQAAASTNGVLAGKSCVVTGTLASRTRDEVHELIKANGGKVSTSISAKTDYLIAGEKAGSKLSKAKKLGVAVLTEEEFDQLLARDPGGEQ